MKTTGFLKINPATEVKIGAHCHTKSPRRNHSHTSLKLPVQFELPGGPVISAFARNLSLKGMQVHCDLTRIKKFVANESGASNVPVLVVMRLQVGNRLSSQVLRCRLRYLKELQAGGIVLDLEFDGLLPDQQQALVSVMQQTLDKPPEIELRDPGGIGASPG